ncbi:MAG: hypothetical protein D6812_02765 [Deltaproteobacteria bacterium]|nr:MAG: hypothetical protein D6812_02765 [Deltaproteobacteria bacterium]
MKERFDVMIVGSNIGGLLTGAILAKYGFKLLWIPFPEDVPIFSKGRYLFPLENPAISGCGEGEILDVALQELGLAQDEKRRFHRVVPPIQLITPRYRIELPAERSALATAIAPLLSPHDRPALEPFFETVERIAGFTNALALSGATIPPQSLSERLRFDKESRSLSGKFGLEGEFGSFEELVRASHFRPETVRFLEMFLTAWGYRLPKESSAYTAAHLLSIPMRGFYYIEGGDLVFLRKLLEGRIRALRGQIEMEIPFERIEKIEFSRKEARIQAGEKDFAGRLLLWNTALPRLLPFLPEKVRRSRFGEKIENLDPALLRFTLLVGMRSQGIPVGMWHRILLQANAPLLDPALGTLYLTLHPLLEGEEERDEKIVILATAFLPLGKGKIVAEEIAPKLERIAKGILDVLHDVIPFLDDFIEVESTEASVRHFSEGAERGQGIVFSTSTVGRLGLSCFSNRTPLQSLLVTGPEIFPGLGFEGEILAGWNATRFAVDLIKH